MTWTTAADIQARARRRWDDGSLLRAYAGGEPFPTISLPVSRPRVAEIGERLGEVQAWVAALDAGGRHGTRYTLELAEVGGRLIGRNTLPSRAIVHSYAQAWALLGTATEVVRYDQILVATAEEPVVRAWVGAHPLQALELHHQWPRIVAAYRWLDDHRDSDRYLREITAPGVDTKFAERHRAVLGPLLGVPSTAGGFIRGLGLHPKPELTRLRPHPGLGLLSPASEIALRHDELPLLPLHVRRALVVENEITYLSVPVPEDGVVLWGKGFEVDRAGSLPWLRESEITYWGDLDTHGFAILHQLRTWLPQTRSLLMDEATLLAHRDRWGTEDSPTAARLDRLSPGEVAVYTALVEDHHGARVRLEQERVDWAWAADQLPR